MRRTRFRPEPPIYTFRVRIRRGFYVPRDAGEIWREIEAAGNQTLADLGDAIPPAFDFDLDHLWSFFLSGKAWDDATEYAASSEPGPFAEEPVRSAADIRLRDVPLPGKRGAKEFLFIYDYGDEWHFGVKLIRTGETVEPGARYPRVVASHGEAPPQYPFAEDEGDEEDEDDEEEEPGGDAPQGKT